MDNSLLAVRDINHRYIVVERRNPMSIQDYIAENKAKNEQWREQKALEREEIKALSEESILEATQKPEVYLKYLEVQAENPHYSASNILLA